MPKRMQQQLFITPTAQIIDIPGNQTFQVSVLTGQDLSKKEFYYILSSQREFQQGSDMSVFLTSQNGMIEGSTLEPSVLLLRSDEPMYVSFDYLHQPYTDFIIYFIALLLFALCCYYLWKMLNQHKRTHSTEQYLHPPAESMFPTPQVVQKTLPPQIEQKALPAPIPVVAEAVNSPVGQTPSVQQLQMNIPTNGASLNSEGRSILERLSAVYAVE